MQSYQQMSAEELLKVKEGLEKEYARFKGMGLSLNMARGKPSTEQLDISMPMLEIFHSGSDLICETGEDCRNYGLLDGLPEAKRLIADMIDTKPENVIVYGNSSLSIMYDTVSRSYTHGVMGNTPWCKLEKVKFLCPTPGYDRHFSITEFFGIEMINVPMTETGPDMDLVEELVNGDESVKGIWCIPKYSNPQGIVYSDETVRRFARLKPAAKDFRIYWDNAYAVHHLYDDDQAEILDIIGECEKAGNPDLVYEFCSTSKISFSGAGVGAMAASPANLEEIRKQLSVQTIGHDKINQLRHVHYFKDMDGIRAHMKKQSAAIRPKFEMILKMFDEELSGLEIGSWLSPKGGYFITFEALEGCAKNIVSRAKEAGVTLTSAGAPYPYGKDPKDSVIRIAPTFPTLDELEKATEIFIICVKLASVEKLLADKK